MNMPKLICLVGIPGAGKTAYANNYIKAYGGVHLSSDGIRKELYGDEAVQCNPHEVFSLMQSRAVEALNDGRTVLYDATNITRKDRASIIAACPKFVRIEAHVIWASIETCIERDASRSRTVGKAVIDKMLKRFQPPFYDEGFHDIKIIIPNSFDNAAYFHKVIDNMRIPHDNPHHTSRVLEHCKEAHVNACLLGIDIELERASLLHDIGKPYTKAFVDSKGNPCETAHYYSHHNVGAWMSYGMPNATPFIAWLIGVHMEPFFDSKYYNKLPPYLKSYVDHLHKCDLDAH